jgi:hypothetical protein
LRKAYFINININIFLLLGKVAPNKGKKKYWTKTEEAAVLKHMHKHILLAKVPGKAECLNLLKREPYIQRSWTDIKHYVRNKITTAKRQKDAALSLAKA